MTDITKVFLVNPECALTDIHLELENLLLQLESLGRSRAVEAQAPDDDHSWATVRDLARQARLLADEILMRCEAKDERKV
jgi:hypothetical protein